MAKKPQITIYDVAQRAGVSRQTVSRVLNDHQDVSAETRNRIQEIIIELNYHPSAIAQSLSRNKSYILGVVTAGLKYTGPSRTLSGITGKAEELGYGLLLKELASYNANNVHPLLNWFNAHQVDGIIWAAPEISNNRDWLADLLPGINIPVIFLTMAERENFSSVAVDNYAGGRLATEHLISLGRTKIGHISGPLDWWEARQRKQGWQDALIAAGLDCCEEQCVEGNWSSASGEQVFHKLRQQFSEMDGLFVANDQMALSVLREGCRQGLAIPEQLAVVGFDGIPESAFYYPALTTIFQDLKLLGEQAVQNTVDLIEVWREKQTISAHAYVIQPTLIVRDSSRKLTL